MQLRKRMRGRGFCCVDCADPPVDVCGRDRREGEAPAEPRAELAPGELLCPHPGPLPEGEGEFLESALPLASCPNKSVLIANWL